MHGDELASDYGEIIESFPEAVLIMAVPDGRVVAANRLARDFFGEEYLSLPLAERYQSYSAAGIGDVWPPLGSHTNSSLYSGQPIVGKDVRVRRKDGRTLYIKINSAPLRAPDGTIRGAIVVFDDVTALKRVEMSASELGAFVRHEMGGELTVTKAAVHALADRCRDLPDQEGLIGHLMGATENLCQMLDNLVAFAETLAGQGKPPKDSVALSEILRDMRDRYLRLGLPPIRLKLGTGLPPVSGSEDWLRIVLRNLLDNAFKYSDPGRHVNVCCRAETGHVTVEVMNRGLGLEPEWQEAAFRPFWRGPNASQSDIHGMGLGLYVSRHLVEAQGGSISISSDGRGKTKVSLTLPASNKG